MSADSQFGLPNEFQAGDTLKFIYYHDQYSPPTWDLSYALRGLNLTAIDFNAVQDGNQWLVNVAPAATDLWQPGTYSASGYVTDGVDRFSVTGSEIVVLPNLFTETSYDNRSYLEQILALIEATIAGTVTRSDISYSINGRNFTAKTDQQLLDARKQIKADIFQEQSKGKNRRVLTRFIQPSGNFWPILNSPIK